MSAKNDVDSSKSGPLAKSQPYWLIYLAMLIGGLLLLAHAMSLAAAQTLALKLAVALLYSAFALCISGSRLTGIWAAMIVWVVVILTFFLQ